MKSQRFDLLKLPHPILFDSGSKLHSTSSIHGVVPEGEGTAKFSLLCHLNPDRPVIYVPGNQEFYHHDIALIDELKTQANVWQGCQAGPLLLGCKIKMCLNVR